MKKVILFLSTITILLNSITAPIVQFNNTEYVQCGNQNPVVFTDCSKADLSSIDMFCCKVNVKLNGAKDPSKPICLLLSKENRINFKANLNTGYDCPNNSSFTRFPAIILGLFAFLFL